MNRTPWQLWDVRSGKPAAGASTLEALEVLQTAMTRRGGMQHPGLLHLYIHLMEMSPTPQRALRAADALRDLVPDAGHLVHMATHIDVLCGRYSNMVESNGRARSRLTPSTWRAKAPTISTRCIAATTIV